MPLGGIGDAGMPPIHLRLLVCITNRLAVNMANSDSSGARSITRSAALEWPSQVDMRRSGQPRASASGQAEPWGREPRASATQRRDKTKKPAALGPPALRIALLTAGGS